MPAIINSESFFLTFPTPNCKDKNM